MSARKNVRRVLGQGQSMATIRFEVAAHSMARWPQRPPYGGATRHARARDLEVREHFFSCEICWHASRRSPVRCGAVRCGCCARRPEGSWRRVATCERRGRGGEAGPHTEQGPGGWSGFGVGEPLYSLGTGELETAPLVPLVLSSPPKASLLFASAVRRWAVCRGATPSVHNHNHNPSLRQCAAPKPFGPTLRLSANLDCRPQLEAQRAYRQQVATSQQALPLAFVPLCLPTRASGMCGRPRFNLRDR
jgi:hypothetical protein